MPVPAEPLPWNQIDTVLIDMDGTLLDLGFDNWFWQQHIPEVYAAQCGLTTAEAIDRLAPRFAAAQGQLIWYCIDHWSRELQIDIRALKLAAGDRIRWLDGAPRFLERLQALGKRRWILTNAHPDTYDIKNARVSLGRYFDAVYSTHPFGTPKETAAFWPRFHEHVSFDPAKTVLIDDSLPVLRAARAYGIRWLRAIRRPDALGPVKDTLEFEGIDSVADLL
jgi:putative hydrolase of the HAD superfamily